MFGFINKLAINAGVERLAKYASSEEAFRKGVGTAFVNNETIYAFFKKYSFQGMGWDFVENPKMYIGYVQIDVSKDDFLCVIIINPGDKGSVVASFHRPAVLLPPGGLSPTLTRLRHQEKIKQGFIDNNLL